MCDAQSADGHCSGSGSSEFVSLGEFRSLPEERTKPVMNGKRIWFFGQKFIDYHSYNFGQYVTFAGAHSTYFDVTSKEWDESESAASAFEPLVEIASTTFSEALFSFNSQIFLFLYVSFGAIAAPDDGDEMLLFVFNEDDRTWRKVAVVNTKNMPTSDKKKPGDGEERRRKLIQVEGNTDDGLYFIDGEFNIYQLRIQLDSAATFHWIDVISHPVRPDFSEPATSTLIDDKIFVQYGRHGCGFHYEPLNLIVYDVTKKSALHIEAKDDKYPHFRFAGALSHAGGVPTANAWSHFCGLTSVGMTGSQFNGQIWSLDNVDSNAPEWRNILPELEVPDPKDHNYHVVFDKVRRDVYMFSKVLGVLKICIGN